MCRLRRQWMLSPAWESLNVVWPAVSVLRVLMLSIFSHFLLFGQWEHLRTAATFLWLVVILLVWKPCICGWFLADQEVQAVPCGSLYSILWQRRSVSMMLSVVILAFVWKRSMQYITEPFLARGTKNHKGRCGYLEGIQWKRSIMKWSRTWSRYIDMLPRLRELVMPSDDSEKGTAFCFRWKWRIGEKSCMCLPLEYKACQSCTETAECCVMFLGALKPGWCCRELGSADPGLPTCSLLAKMNKLKPLIMVWSSSLCSW